VTGLEWLSLVGLAGVFAIASLRPVNIGLLGLAAAFLVGVVGAGFAAKDVLAGFPGDLFVTIVGITYLFGAARANGTIDWLVDRAAALLGNRPALMPILVFAIAALLTAVGALGPVAVAILAPVALRYASLFRIAPLLMGLATIHGAQAGAFSPVSVYGSITNATMEKSGLEIDPIFLALASFAFNAAIFAIVYAAMLRSGAHSPVSVPEFGAPGSGGSNRLNRAQAITLAGLCALAIGALVFRLDIGLCAVTIAVALAIISPLARASLKNVDWETALLISGVVTYVAVMQSVGTIDALGEAAGLLATPQLAALAICMIAGVISAFSSSTALLGVLVPLAVPVILQGNLSAAGVVGAIAISTTIVDTSPFSTNGALVVSNADEQHRVGLLRQLLAYTVAIVLAGPTLAWAIFA
jgi:di/tricarboxylate transporter